MPWRGHPGKTTERARTAVEELRAKGVEVTQEPMPQPWGMTEVRFKDQDGNEFLLYGPVAG